MPIHVATFLFTRTRTILANWSTMVKPQKLAQSCLPLAHLQTQEDCAKCPDCTLCSMQTPTGFRSQSLLSLLCGQLWARYPHQPHFEVSKLVIL